MPSPFVIPGVTLEEVLGACKAERGRDLYTLAATAATDLADYVRERREDGDLELVELAGAPAADPPSAAGAPPPATVSRSTPELEALLTPHERSVRAFLEDHAGEWHALRDVAAAIGIPTGAAGTALRTWRLLGVVEHNGKLRTAARVRIPPRPAGDPEAMPVDLEDDDDAPLGAGPALMVDRESTPGPATAPRALHPVDADGDGRPDDEPLGISPLEPPRHVARANGSPELSPRVRRELEREERERREREAQAAGRRELADGGTLEGRVTIALGRRLERGATLPELANELSLATGNDLRDLAAVLHHLEETDETRRAGRRRNHVIYVARNATLA